jgi:hypothetical protein
LILDESWLYLSINHEITGKSINSGARLAGLARGSDFEIKMFIRGSSLHYVQLLIAHVRSNSERQILIQIVASHSKTHGFPQEAARALRTYALVVQSSYGRKAKSLKVQALMNKMVTEQGGGNYHRKTFVSILKNGIAIVNLCRIH